MAKADVQNLVEAAKAFLRAHPVYRSHPIGAPGSAARLAQIERNEAEDALRAAIRRVEQPQ